MYQYRVKENCFEHSRNINKRFLSVKFLTHFIVGVRATCPVYLIPDVVTVSVLGEESYL